MRQLLANTLGINEKYLGKLPHDSLERAYIKLRIQNLTGTPLSYNSVLQKELLVAFALQLNPTTESTEGYVLQIKDSSKLQPLRTDCNGSTIRYKDGKFTASSISLQEMSKIMDRHLDDYIRFLQRDTNCYVIDFPVYKDVSKANDYFEKYGLALAPVSLDLAFYDIQVRKSSAERGTRTLQR